MSPAPSGAGARGGHRSFATRHVPPVSSRFLASGVNVLALNLALQRARRPRTRATAFNQTGNFELASSMGDGWSVARRPEARALEKNPAAQRRAGRVKIPA